MSIHITFASFPIFVIQRRWWIKTQMPKIPVFALYSMSYPRNNSPITLTSVPISPTSALHSSHSAMVCSMPASVYSSFIKFPISERPYKMRSSRHRSNADFHLSTSCGVQRVALLGKGIKPNPKAGKHEIAGESYKTKFTARKTSAVLEKVSVRI